MKLTIRQLLTTLLIILGSINYAVADTVWIDVRSTQEHTESNIAGDINIIHTDIKAEITKHVSNKDTEIKLYCRSGKRAGIALKQLKEMGYTNVTNVGGIEDARAARKQENK